MEGWTEIVNTIKDKEFEGRDEFISSSTDFVNGLNEGAQARITELETEVETLKSELQATQAKNYELIMAQTAQNSEPEETEDVTEEQKDVEKLIKED